MWPAGCVLDSKAAPYGDGEMSSSKKANGLAVLSSLFVVVAAVGSAAAAVTDGKRRSCLHTIRHTFSLAYATGEEPYGFGMTATYSALRSGRSVCLSPAFPLTRLAHGPPESA